MMTSVFSKKPVLDFKLDNVSLCVVPANNIDEMEIQFTEAVDKHEDGLVQMTFHFPASTEEDDEDEPSAAQKFHKDIMDSGIIRSATGNIIAEFTKEQGNFVTPRGKYAIQVKGS